MNGTTIALAVAGLAGFLAGAYLAATGDRESGIALMGAGLLCQILCLRQLRLAKKKETSDAGR